jgi:ubiquinone/menaquinone biosynthesis C-methylase UbiE
MNGSFYDLHASPVEKLLGMTRLRRELLSYARGKTLEVSTGTGRNFPLYPEGIEITAMEPDAGMRSSAELRASRRAGVTLGDAEAEALPFPDQSFDTVVATLALCSMDDPEAAIREAYRVLRPEGRLLLLEHIRMDSKVVGKIQDLFDPAWRKVTGGCHLNRRPADWIGRSAFRIEKHESLWGGAGGLWVLKRP